MIEYLENSNLALCDGYKFRKDKKSGYWLCSTIKKRLHIYIYEKYYGPIPKGYEVHHKDHNKDNNEIDNLLLVTKKEHIIIHKKELSKEAKEKLKLNLEKNARPKAIEWHKSKIGKEWHKKHYESMKDKLFKTYQYKCLVCENEYTTTQIKSKFCSNKCKAKYRRENKLDCIELVCIICGTNYFTNKYRPNITCSRKCASVYKKGY